MQKIVINSCYGGFSLSTKAVDRLLELGYKVEIGGREVPRDEVRLIQVVGELEGKANGGCAELRIIEIPDGVDWEIEEYDGMEWVAERHRRWG